MTEQPQDANWNIADWHDKMLIDRNDKTRQAAGCLCRH